MDGSIAAWCFMAIHSDIDARRKVLLIMTPIFLILLTLVGLVLGIVLCIAGAWLPAVVFLFIGAGAFIRIVKEFLDLRDEP